MFLADILSQPYLPEVNTCNHELSANLEEIDHTTIMLLAVSKVRLTQIRHASDDDAVLWELRVIIQQGWPDCKKEICTSICTRPACVQRAQALLYQLPYAKK